MEGWFDSCLVVAALITLSELFTSLFIVTEQYNLVLVQENLLDEM